MQQAAQEPRYLAALWAVSRDFAAVDAESWTDY